jgi:D-alanyl-D-alanine carboxypeptidase (penicillin-binding protein 5/6)
MKPLALLIAFVLMPVALMAQTISETAAPARPTALFVYHPETDTIIQSVNAETRMGPASLTKMMTLYLTFEALKEGKLTTGTLVPVSEKAWRTGGSKMFIEVGTQVSVEDLIRGIAIVSGNDACVAIAEQLGGTEEGFAGLMNAKAQDLKMTGTNFVNANGLPDPNQYTTAHDMARLLTAIFRDFPEYKHYMAEQEFTFNGIKQQNRNRLLGLNMGIDASKTGHTEESGYHLASTAVQNGERLVVVVMGTAGFNDREGNTLQAFRTTFSTYARQSFAKPGDAVVASVPVWHGAVGNVPLTVAEPAGLYINRANAPKLKA